MYKLLLPLLIISLLFACKKEVDNLPVERPFVRDFYVQGRWRDTLPIIFSPFDYTVGKLVEAPSGNQFTCHGARELLPTFKTIQSGIYGLSSTNPLFLVRFSSLDIENDWSAAELEDLFVPGRIFPITGNPGEVEIGFEIPALFNTSWINESGKAPNPSGEVKILAIEPYETAYYNIFNFLITRKGYKVRLEFHANLGRVQPLNGQLKVVGTAALQDGEASLFFEY
jgi:hypothetical protein